MWSYFTSQTRSIRSGSQFLAPRFRREARAASTLSHPRICTIHHIDRQDDQPFIVIELMQGQTAVLTGAGRKLSVTAVLGLGVSLLAVAGGVAWLRGQRLKEEAKPTAPSPTPVTRPAPVPLLKRAAVGAFENRTGDPSRDSLGQQLAGGLWGAAAFSLCLLLVWKRLRGATGQGLSAGGDPLGRLNQDLTRFCFSSEKHGKVAPPADLTVW